MIPMECMMPHCTLKAYATVKLFTSVTKHHYCKQHLKQAVGAL